MTAPRKLRRLLRARTGLGALGLVVGFVAVVPPSADAAEGRLRGATVVGTGGEELGRVVDVVDPGAEGVGFAVLSTQGVPGLDEGLYPVPLAALRGAGLAREVEPADRLPGEPEPSGLLGLRAEDLIGRDVYSETGEAVARIEDVVVVDRNVYLVLGVGGLLGVADEEVALPIERFELRIDDVVLTRPVSADGLEAMASSSYEPGEGQTVPRERTVAEVMAVIGERGITAADLAEPDEAPAAIPAATPGTGTGNGSASEALILDINRERLSRAPRLAEADGVPATASPAWHDDVLTYYRDLLPGGTAPRITGGRALGSSPSNQ